MNDALMHFMQPFWLKAYTYLTFKPTFVRNLKKLTHCLLAFNNVFINCLKDLPHEYTNLYYHSNLRQHFVFLRKFSKAFKKVGNVQQIYRTLPQGQAVHQIMISFISLDLWLCYDYVKLEMDRVMDGHNPMIYYPCIHLTWFGIHLFV